jgi:hypothetical protein
MPTTQDVEEFLRHKTGSSSLQEIDTDGTTTISRQNQQQQLFIMSNRVCHFKLVLLGDTAVGKSCLVVRFVRDEFFEFQEPTIGGKS